MASDAESIPVPTRLVWLLAAAILGGLGTIAGAVVVWNIDYVATRANYDARIERIEAAIGPGILGKADVRVTNVERRLDRLEAWRERHDERTPQE